MALSFRLRPSPRHLRRLDAPSRSFLPGFSTLFGRVPHRLRFACRAEGEFARLCHGLRLFWRSPPLRAAGPARAFIGLLARL